MTRVARRSAPRFDLALTPRTIQAATIFQPAAAAAAAALRDVEAGIEHISGEERIIESIGMGTTPGATSSLGGVSPASPASVPFTGPQRWCDGPSRITEHLYLGTHSDAADAMLLGAVGVRRILNVAEECTVDKNVQERNGLQTLHLAIRDHSDENIAQHFSTAIKFIRDGVERGETVLVHCRMGVSRSATMVVAYLMCYGFVESEAQTISYRDAFDFLKLCRPQVSPNLGFVLALHELDRTHGFGGDDVHNAFEMAPLFA